MSKTIKSIKTLKKHLGETVHVVSYDGYEFDAKVVDSLRGGYLGLFTTDKAAENDTYWWSGVTDGYCHIVTKPYQIKTELKSITLLEAKGTKAKVKKTAKKSFVSADTLKANKGHYCEMADGSTGFIAGSKYPGHVCVLHNSEGPSDGWSIRRSGNASEIKGVTKSFIKKFSKGWHVGNVYDATGVKVAKILEENRSDTEFLTRSELLKGIGHFCELSDGSKGFICQTRQGNPRVLSNVKKAGWLYEPADYSGDTAPETLKKTFSRAFNISDEADAKHVEVVEVLKEGVKNPRARQKTVTLEDLRNNIGHCCTFKSGDKGYICKSTGGSLLICFNTQQNGNGWEVDGDVPKYLHKHFKYAYFIMNDECKKALGVASIDPEETDFQATESKKTVLDMTVRELLEKLNEIVIG